jgi:hypothetical protein
VQGPAKEGADPEEQSRIYKQFYSDLIRRGTEGLRHLNRGVLPSANAPESGEPHQAPIPSTAAGADEEAKEVAEQVCSLWRLIPDVYMAPGNVRLTVCLSCMQVRGISWST